MSINLKRLSMTDHFATTAVAQDANLGPFLDALADSVYAASVLDVHVEGQDISVTVELRARGLTDTALEAAAFEGYVERTTARIMQAQRDRMEEFRMSDLGQGPRYRDDV